MVKNTTGGSFHKKIARKSNGNSRGEFTWDQSDPNLLLVSVTKPLGDCRFSVQTRDRRPLICHLSSKYSGRFKHHNMVVANCVILVSLRPYENPSTHCDFIHKMFDVTSLDFFTVRLPTEHSPVMEDDLDIFRSNSAALPRIQEGEGEAQGDQGEAQQGEEIDFDAI